MAIGFALPIFAQEKNTADPPVAQQIRAAAKKYDEAFSKNDAPALALFTEDVVQVAPEGVFYGREAMEKRYQKWCSSNGTETTMSTWSIR
jgi:ketosteroid isomerase-like protein